MITNTATLSCLLLVLAPSSYAQPNIMSLKSCGVNGNARKCTVDRSHFNINKPDGDIVQIDFGHGHRYACRSQGTAHGAAWHANCSSGSSSDGGVDGTMNVVSRGTNSQGQDCTHGSLSVTGDICQFGPDATCGEIIVECKPASEFPQGAEPRGVAKDHFVGSRGDEVELSSRFRKLVTDPVDEKRKQKGVTSLLRGATAHHRGLADDLGGNLDIMVVWTKNSECKKSGLDAGCDLTQQTEENMRGHIDLAVAETNVAFDNSGINTQLRLVHAYRDGTYVEMAGTDYETFSSALDSITLTADGVMDDVHDKRDLYGADLVAMLIDDVGSIGGLAWVGPYTQFMFSVTRWDVATGKIIY